MIEKIINIPKLKSEVVFWIGKNASENFDLIDQSQPHYLWFHVDNMPSCHVVACTDESWKRKEISYIIKQGALLCKIHSKYNSFKNLPIIYTKMENVTKTDVIGSVLLKQEKIILI